MWERFFVVVVGTLRAWYACFSYCLRVMFVIRVVSFNGFFSFDDDVMKGYNHDLVVYITFPVSK